MSKFAYDCVSCSERPPWRLFQNGFVRRENKKSTINPTGKKAHELVACSERAPRVVFQKFFSCRVNSGYFILTTDEFVLKEPPGLVCGNCVIVRFTNPLKIARTVDYVVLHDITVSTGPAGRCTGYNPCLAGLGID